MYVVYTSCGPRIVRPLQSALSKRKRAVSPMSPIACRTVCQVSKVVPSQLSKAV